MNANKYAFNSLPQPNKVSFCMLCQFLCICFSFFLYDTYFFFFLKKKKFKTQTIRSAVREGGESAKGGSRLMRESNLM